MSDWIYFAMAATLCVPLSILLRAGTERLFASRKQSRGLLLLWILVTNIAAYVVAAERPALVQGDHWSPIVWLAFCGLSALIALSVTPRTP